MLDVEKDIYDGYQKEQDEAPGVVIKGLAQGFRFFDEGESLARAVIESREIVAYSLSSFLVKLTVRGKLSFMAYACEHPTRRKRTPMDVDKTVADWLPLMTKLATAHDVDEKDASARKLDEMLMPVLAAPVAQIREFYQKLTAAMKADQTVPWALWKLMEFWGQNVLDKMSKEEEKGLKTALATKIAERSVDEIPRGDWVKSMVAALEWRSSEKLEQVDKALDSGKKPRVRGGESCLFLAVEGTEAEVML